MKTELKTIHYILELLAKCEKSDTKSIHGPILANLAQEALCAKTRFTCEQIQTLMQKNSDLKVDSPATALVYLTKYRHEALPEALVEAKQSLFITLIGANFPEKKHHLDVSLKEFEAALSPVEAKMYGLIGAYLTSMQEAIELYAIFDESKEASFEALSAYTIRLHEAFMEALFYEEERLLAEEGLGKMAAIFAGVYYQYLYM